MTQCSCERTDDESATKRGLIIQIEGKIKQADTFTTQNSEISQST